VPILPLESLLLLLLLPLSLMLLASMRHVADFSTFADSGSPSAVDIHDVPTVLSLLLLSSLMCPCCTVASLHGVAGFTTVSVPAFAVVFTVLAVLLLI
jgi:hypothetical protein